MGAMAANWIDVSDLSIYHLLLLEKVPRNHRYNEKHTTESQS